ncbi:nuclear transport factor 2 family protein [Paraflavitalea speifideaquila]|uniref:nuclear transport factor 2 family protein n=1 Tax=Paraflavitalea speifideaquila TaxID=3076558 RepID=UPI0028E98387|nr:nuclear transport factor 2 family protein [Paraflavitalea speifideiaquila]
MDNRQIIQEVIAAFDNNQPETILHHLAEDVTWNMVGDQVVSGKDEMRAFLLPCKEWKWFPQPKSILLLTAIRSP